MGQAARPAAVLAAAHGPVREAPLTVGPLADGAGAAGATASTDAVNVAAAASAATFLLLLTSKSEQAIRLPSAAGRHDLNRVAHGRGGVSPWRPMSKTAALLCSDCGWGDRAANCVACNRHVPGTPAPAWLCDDCAWGNGATTCLRCGKSTYGGAVAAVRCSDCAWGDRALLCSRCGRHTT